MKRPENCTLMPSKEACSKMTAWLWLLSLVNMLVSWLSIRIFRRLMTFSTKPSLTQSAPIRSFICPISTWPKTQAIASQEASSKPQRLSLIEPWPSWKTSKKLEIPKGLPISKTSVTTTLLIWRKRLRLEQVPTASRNSEQLSSAWLRKVSWIQTSSIQNRYW